MEDYNKIIESLSVKFVKAREVDILKPVVVENSYEVENYLLMVTSGIMKYGKERSEIYPGEIVFIPGGKPIALTYGEGNYSVFSKEDFMVNRSDYLVLKKDTNQGIGSYCYVAFDVKAFDSVNFFNTLDLPPFKIKNNAVINEIVTNVNAEFREDRIGKDRISKLYTDILAVELIRHILNEGLFIEKFATNTTYFKDQRLIRIFTFIKDNLDSDLSNKVLAKVADVSEDYIGQYFKMLTGINPQDYIEYQRMEVAVNLLRTSKRSIRDIGREVGYKDTAYFCRRFKIMFGIPAGKMRKRESLINI